MNLHEFQGKQILASYGVRVQRGNVASTAEEAVEDQERSGRSIGMELITPQIPATGKGVHRVLIAEDVYYPGDNEPSEFYMSGLLDRSEGRNMIMYSTEGGMDLEEVAEKT